MAAAKKVAKVKEVKSTTKGVTVANFSAKGEKGTTRLSEAIFGQKPNLGLLAQATRVYLSNQRSAQAKTKTRGEMTISTAKIYKQKGTGNARHGAKSAPIFVGGGIAHGPTGKQNYKLEIPKQMRKSVLISALSAKVATGSLFISDLEKTGPKTKIIATLLKKMDLKYPTAIVHNHSGDLYKAARNIKGIFLIPASELTAYHLLAVKNVVMTNEAAETLETKLKSGK